MIIEMINSIQNPECASPPFGISIESLIAKTVKSMLKSSKSNWKCDAWILGYASDFEFMRS